MWKFKLIYFWLLQRNNSLRGHTHGIYFLVYLVDNMYNMCNLCVILGRWRNKFYYNVVHEPFW